MKQVDGEDSVVAVYALHPDAENATTLLKKNNFNMKNVAVMGQSDQTKERLTAYYSTGDRMEHWGKNGAFWSGMFALLAGSAVFAIPGVGLVMVAGSAVPWIVGVLGTALGSRSMWSCKVSESQDPVVEPPEKLSLVPMDTRTDNLQRFQNQQNVFAVMSELLFRSETLQGVFF